MDVQAAYNLIEDGVLKIFDKAKATKQVERSLAPAMLPLPFLKGEGAAVQFDNLAGQRFIYNMEPYEVASGFAVTKKMILNNQYKSEFNTSALNMKDVFLQFKQIAATAVLNNAATITPNLGGDGVAFASASHPYDGGTWGNRFAVDLDLNEASLLQAGLNMRQTFVDERGNRISAMQKKLIVPIQLGPVAERLTTAERRPGTFSNDPNILKTGYFGVPEGYQVLNFLSSNFGWMVQTNQKGLVHLEHQPFSMHTWVDDFTNNLLVTGYEYYGFFYKNPRSMYFSFPTS